MRGSGARTWALGLLVAVVSACAFLPALDGPFLCWDDRQNLVDQASWRGLSLAHLSWMFTTFHWGPYQPLAWFTYAIDHELFGLRAFAFHRTNLVLHGAGVLATFFLARRLVAIVRPQCTPVVLDLAACAAAGFFGLHPLRAESVAWITERRDVLAQLFYALCITAWLGWRTQGGARRHAIALALFALALLSKGTGMLLPCALLVLEIWPFGALRGAPRADYVRRILARVRTNAGFFVLGVLFAGVAWWGQAHAAMSSLERHGAVERVVQALHGLVFYPARTLVPIDLSPLYELPRTVEPTAPRFLVSMAGALLFAAAAWFLRRRAPAFATAAACYAVLVLPVLGFSQVGPQLVADRYSELTCLPFALLFGGAVAWLHARRPGAGSAIALLVVAWLAVLGTLAWRQSRIWRSDVALWQHAVVLDPSSPRAHLELARAWNQAASDARDPAERRAALEQSLQACRAGRELRLDAMLELELAITCDLCAKSDPAGAERWSLQSVQCARRALEIMRRTGPPSPPIYRVLGVLLLENGEPAEAVVVLGEAVQLRPQNVELRTVLAEALVRTRRAPEALQALAPLLARPETAPIEAWHSAARAHELLGNPREELRCWRTWIALAPRFPARAGDRTLAEQRIRALESAGVR